MESKTTAPQADQAGIWTPANIVTCVRIAFIPVFMVLAELSCVQAGAVYLQAPAIAAFALYVLLSLTISSTGTSRARAARSRISASSSTPSPTSSSSSRRSSFCSSRAW